MLTVREMKRLKRNNIIRNISVFVITFVIMFLFFRYVRFPSVDGSSMSPTYEDGDVLTVLYMKDVKPNDIVVLWNKSLDEYIVKRVVATEGDHVEIRDNGLYVNGSYVDEPYIKESDWVDDINNVNIIVPEDSYYVLGDNRNDSVDSRILGTFRKEDVFGKVLFRLFVSQKGDLQ